MLQESTPQFVRKSPAAAQSRNTRGVSVPAVQPVQRKQHEHDDYLPIKDEPIPETKAFPIPAINENNPAPAAIPPFQLKTNNTGLPHQLKTGIENLSGYSMDDVKVHYNSDKPARLTALAYAQGSDIHIGPGQEKHLPHEAWHVVQQKQGRVVPNLQMKGAMINDDSSLENEADIMGEKAMALNNTGVPVAVKQAVTGGNIIQAKKEIKGNKDFTGKGNLLIHFEEMIKGSSAGMYGYISFNPFPDGDTAEKIELVQIASLRTNDNGQAAYEKSLMPESAGEKDPPEVKETNLDTDGVNPVKNMVRNSSPSQHFIDLLYTNTAPRGHKSGVPNVEMAYNAERRNAGNSEDRMDEVFMSKTDKVRNHYDLMTQKQDPSAEKIIMQQFPGYNRGKGELRRTELHDFPVSSKPSVFSFQTSVDAEGCKSGKKEYWGVVKWGFTTLFDVLNGYSFVASVDPLAFVAGDTDELRESRNNFDAIFANSSAWTSPETLDDIDFLLKKGDRAQGLKDLDNAAREFIFVLGKILEEGKNEPDVLNRIAGPHKINVSWVLKELEAEHGNGDDLFIRLSKKYKEVYT
ncbi:DUF4157 domain-containing protein [Chitinophaga sp. OAE865]|uniref:eCIS core domain-containing protein n=1 Tax=Chitinophaga sp. OAE865 TaxID=2817898 RepID=UPI001AEA77FA